MIKDDKTSEHSLDLNLSELMGTIDDEISSKLSEQQDDAAKLETATALESIGRHICFSLADKQLAVPLSFVREAGELQIIQPLPFLPGWLEGVTNIRGEIISVINLAKFLEINDGLPVKGQTFIVIGDESMKTALAVDKINGTRLLYRKEDERAKSGATGAFSIDFSDGRAVFLVEKVESEIELLNVNKFLSTIRLK